MGHDRGGLLAWYAVDVRNTERLERLAPRLRVVRLPDAGHWIQRAEPERVHRELMACVRAGLHSEPQAE